MCKLLENRPRKKAQLNPYQLKLKKNGFALDTRWSELYTTKL
jgi:hypothetical protein